MGLFDRLLGLDEREKALKAEIAIVEARVTKSLTTHLDDGLLKASAPGGTPSNARMIQRYNFDSLNMNQGIYSRKKPDSTIPFDVLRKFSVVHEVTRAAINYRKRQLSGLSWEIVTADTEDTGDYGPQIIELQNWFKQIGGSGNKYRKFMARVVEDLLVLDAVALYKRPNMVGNLYTIEPIDSSTIRLRVADDGSTPLPPETAFKQVIRGQVVAEFTTDEMIYEMMNPRTNSPYGLAPLESLMVIVSSSLKAGLWNLTYMTDGNIPEGFFGVPKEWTPQMINDFQETWDGVMAGDEAAFSRLHFMPEGSYTPTKKPNDMAWEQFSDWLMKITCALFDVDPKEIGFHPNKGGMGGSAAAVQGAETSDARGLKPLAQFMEEIFNEVIQIDLGMPHLAFKYMGLDGEKDQLTDAQVKEIQINTGMRTINEIRTDDGLDPIDGLDRPFVLAQSIVYLDQQAQDTAAEAAAASAVVAEPAAAPEAEAGRTTSKPGNDDATKDSDTAKMAALVTELRSFRKYALNRFKSGRSLRPFVSEVLPAVASAELNKRLAKAVDTSEVRSIFQEYMQDYQIDFLANVYDLKTQLKEVL